MDFQRIFLIGGIVLTVFLLLTEWGKFKEEHDIKKILDQQSTRNVEISTTQADIPVDTPSASEDIPVVTSQTTTAAEVSNNETVDKNNIISISTDVLNIEINRLGGDIVHASLPKFSAHIDTPDIPFTLLENQHRLYIAQSGLVGVNATDTKDGRPVFFSEKNQFSMSADQDELSVDLSFLADENVSIIKRYQFHRSDYLIHLTYLIDNRSDKPWKANLYGQIKRDNSPDPATSSGGSMGVQPFLGVATTTNESRFEKFTFDDMDDENFSTTREDGWIAMVQHYFLSAWIPAKGEQFKYSTVATQNGQYLARFTGPEILVPAGQQGEITAQFYVGPKDQYRLQEIAEGLDLSVDYGWLWMIAQPLFALLKFFFDLTHNWGWAIIFLTISVKILFFYPSAMSYKSMAKMRKVQPKMLEIRERWPDDRQKQSQAMMELYKKEKVNPMGGCLPILIQMPVFIALYWVLLESYELRHAPFMGYIKDLSAMDPYFILPLVMGASMFFQQKLNPPPPDPTQAKVMQFLPIIFTFFFLFFPSGLVLYWVVNNLLSITQQWVITRQIEAAD